MPFKSALRKMDNQFVYLILTNRNETQRRYIWPYITRSSIPQDWTLYIIQDADLWPACLEGTRMFWRDTCASPFGYQVIEVMDLELEFPHEEGWNLVSVTGWICPWKEDYVSSEHLAGEAETRMGHWWAGLCLDKDSLFSIALALY